MIHVRENPIATHFESVVLNRARTQYRNTDANAIKDQRLRVLRSDLDIVCQWFNDLVQNMASIPRDEFGRLSAEEISHEVEAIGFDKPSEKAIEQIGKLEFAEDELMTLRPLHIQQYALNLFVEKFHSANKLALKYCDYALNIPRKITKLIDIVFSDLVLQAHKRIRAMPKQLLWENDKALVSDSLAPLFRPVAELALPQVAEAIPNDQDLVIPLYCFESEDLVELDAPMLSQQLFAMIPDYDAKLLDRSSKGINKLWKWAYNPVRAIDLPEAYKAKPVKALKVLANLQNVTVNDNSAFGRAMIPFLFAKEVYYRNLAIKALLRVVGPIADHNDELSNALDFAVGDCDSENDHVKFVKTIKAQLT